MTIAIMEKLMEQGWYLSDHGYNLVSDSENISDIQKIIKRCLDFDLREIGSGQGDIYQEGNIILQIQKLRNVSAPKNNEESCSAPRMLKLSLTDGKNNYQALEVNHISSLSLNTPPGTKLLLRTENLSMSHGIILLRSFNTVHVLGGRVANLVEKWELNKKLALHTRVRLTEEGGPPPWIPFGKKIIKVTDQDKNFKALAEKEKSTKENAEFEAQRKDAIAEAAKHGSKKVFGGGNKQLLDHSVQKIVDHGFSIEQAEYALKVNRNNVDKALKSLQKTDSKHKELKEQREPRGKRFDKKVEESKPSSGKISLFDFLEDKLPVQTESSDANCPIRNDQLQYSETNYDGVDTKHGDAQGGRSGKSQRGARGYQVPPRHSEENKVNKKFHSNSSGPPQYPHYNGSTSQQNKPPRFQRNQETHNYYQETVNKSGYQRGPQGNDYRNTYAHSRDGGNTNDNVNYSKYPYDEQDKNFSGNRNYNHVDSDIRNRHTYDASYGRHIRTQDGNQRTYTATTTDKNYKNQLSRYPNDNAVGKEAVGSNSQRSNNYNSHNQNSKDSSSTWVWQIGDKCLAKYWEDERYYNAVVTGVSDRTCVVQFKGFKNYEEVLQVDCIPITDDENIQEFGESKRPDQYSANKQHRYEQGHNHITAGMEFRRGGSGAGSGNKGYNKKRGQRSSQPIYQPPAQRTNNSMTTNVTQHNSLV